MRLKAVIALVCAALAIAAPAASSHQYQAGPLLIVHPHAVSLVPGRPVALYVTVVNKSDTADALVGVHCQRASKAELHEHVMTDGVMKMGEVTAIEVPAHGKAELKPGGYHVMLFDVTGPLAPGDFLPVEFEFRSAGRIAVEAMITKPGSESGAAGHSGHDATQ